MKLPLIATFVICLLLLSSAITGQETEETGLSIPDVTTLSLPEAAAVLNRNALRLGDVTFAEWRVSSGQDMNTISTQQPAAAESAAPGTAVNVTLLRENNTMLIYDSNDLTMLNQSDTTIRVRETVFQSTDGGSTAAFSLSQLRVNELLSGPCIQVWSINRDGFKDIEDCSAILRDGFHTTTNPAEHFWTGANGATEFDVIQDGVYRGTCGTIAADTPNRGTDLEQPQRCTFYLAPDLASGDVIEYVYMTYTTDQLLVINPSTDRWLPTSQVSTIEGFTMSDPTHFEGERVGDTALLAPGQCLRFLREGIDPATPLPESCEVIAEGSLTDNDVFWTREFNIENRLIENQRVCLAAIPDETMLCLLPR